eukprot:evm.model.scf_688.6 EVM.evm.TU.scf_688.6   scf_688:30298-32963(+)
MASDEDMNSARSTSSLARVGSSPVVVRAVTRARALRKTLTSKMERLALGFEDAPFSTEQEKEVAAGVSTVAEGVWSKIGKALKIAMKFAGPDYTEAIGCHEYATDPSAADKVVDNSNCDDRSSAVSAEHSRDSARSLGLEDAETVKFKKVFENAGEVELQAVMETTTISDINEGDEITAQQPHSDRSAPSTSGASSSGTSLSGASTSGASTSEASTPSSSYPVADEA